MRFLELVQIEEWCDKHGIRLSNRLPTPDPLLSHHARSTYSEGKRSGRELSVAASCVKTLGAWEECLLWVTGWGIWASGEDWPKYYAARGARGERRSLQTAPGHLFEAGESTAMTEFITLVLENAWDAFILPAALGGDMRLRICVSHDEWLEVCSTAPIAFRQ